MKTKKSIWLPLLLLVYLMVMAYVGRGQVAAGKYLQYFGVMGVSLLVIVLLHFTLKHKERLKKLRDFLHVLWRVEVLAIFFIVDVGAPVYPGVVCNISLPQSFLVTKPAQLVRCFGDF